MTLTLRTWRILAAAAAVLLYLASISGPFYELTTPVGMHHHIFLRKTYAVGAFSLLGFLLQRSELWRVRGVVAAALVVGVYSYAIEIGQIFIDRAFETFNEHGFDVASGVVGGALGAFVVLLFTAPSAPRRRIEALAIVLMFGALVWFYTTTYGLRDV